MEDWRVDLDKRAVNETVMRCPFCRDRIQEFDESRTCPRCETRSHSACIEQHGRCVVFGCHDAQRLFSGRPGVDPRKWTEFLWGMMMWTTQAAGLAFLLFLPVTMMLILLLPAPLFRQYVLTYYYLPSFLVFSVVTLLLLQRAALQYTEERATFAASSAVLFAAIWLGSSIWITAHLPH